MKRLARTLLVILAMGAFPLIARADCKKCGGRTCNSVSDLEAGNDACRIKVEEIMHVGTTGVWIEWHYTCEPSGDACTNLHSSITVTGSPDWQQVGSGF
jgi:hypothetical protein